VRGSGCDSDVRRSDCGVQGSDSGVRGSGCGSGVFWCAGKWLWFWCASK
jgi:hypothetical protein